MFANGIDGKVHPPRLEEKFIFTKLLWLYVYVNVSGPNGPLN